MSHCPGDTLEDFLTDWYGIVVEDHGSDIRWLYKGQKMLTNEQFETLVAIMEPVREDVERLISYYDEDENGSWHDYRNYAIGRYIPDDLNDKGDEYLTSLDTPTTPGIVP